MLLAEKQATLEKLEWEVSASNSKIEELEESMGSMEFEISSFMKLFEKLCGDSLAGNEDFSIPSLRVDPVLTGVNYILHCRIFVIFCQRIIFFLNLACIESFCR